MTALMLKKALLFVISQIRILLQLAKVGLLGSLQILTKHFCVKFYDNRAEL